MVIVIKKLGRCEITDGKHGKLSLPSAFLIYSKYILHF